MKRLNKKEILRRIEALDIATEPMEAVVAVFVEPIESGYRLTVNVYDGKEEGSVKQLFSDYQDKEEALAAVEDIKKEYPKTRDDMPIFIDDLAE